MNYDGLMHIIVMGFSSRQKNIPHAYTLQRQKLFHKTIENKDRVIPVNKTVSYLNIDNCGKVSFLEFLWIVMELLQSNIILQTLFMEVTLKHNISCENSTFENTCVPFKHFNWKIVMALKFLSYKLSIFQVYSKTFCYFLNSSF